MINQENLKDLFAKCEKVIPGQGGSFVEVSMVNVPQVYFDRVLFAELLITECATLAAISDAQSAVGQWGAPWAIMKHFGLDANTIFERKPMKVNAQ